LQHVPKSFYEHSAKNFLINTADYSECRAKNSCFSASDGAKIEGVLIYPSRANMPEATTKTVMKKAPEKKN